MDEEIKLKKQEKIKMKSGAKVAKAFNSISKNRRDILEYILSRNLANIESVDHLGNTMLNVAVQHGNYDISSFLVKNTANVNTQNKDLNTPLHYAIEYGFSQLIDLLLENGANENLRNKNKNSPWEGI
mmetsp:Transcript_51792/g.71137  ORF Transcript_51792/g.71137 Transcript_51792/m.71137 type:complete len:128 (-) Transcript_51792:193-576(-)